MLASCPHTQLGNRIWCLPCDRQHVIIVIISVILIVIILIIIALIVIISVNVILIIILSIVSIIVGRWSCAYSSDWYDVIPRRDVGTDGWIIAVEGNSESKL